MGDSIRTDKRRQTSALSSHHQEFSMFFIQNCTFQNTGFFFFVVVSFSFMEWDCGRFQLLKTKIQRSDQPKKHCKEHDTSRVSIHTQRFTDQIKNTCNRLKQTSSTKPIFFKYNNLQSETKSNQKLSKNGHSLIYTLSFEKLISSKELLSCCFLLTPVEGREERQKHQHHV